MASFRVLKATEVAAIIRGRAESTRDLAESATGYRADVLSVVADVLDRLADDFRESTDA